MKLDPADIESLRPLLRVMAGELLEELLARRLPIESAPNSETVRLCYSEAEAAAMLGEAIHRLREQRRLGHIQYCRGPGRRIKYTRAQLDAYLMRKPA